MTAQERVQRNSEVFNARARGLSWPTVAAQFDLSERQCRRIFAEHREATGSLAYLDASEIVRDTLDAYDAAIEELALLANDTSHGGTRLGAIRGRLDAVKSRWELMRAVRVLPANLEQLWPEFDAQRVARTILHVLDKHQVPLTVQPEIFEAVDDATSGEELAASVVPTETLRRQRKRRP